MALSSLCHRSSVSSIILHCECVPLSSPNMLSCRFTIDLGHAKISLDRVRRASFKQLSPNFQTFEIFDTTTRQR